MAFDAKKVKDDIIKWIRDWFEVNGKGCNAIVAISGGKDSSVVAALCVEALGKDRVIGVLLPKGEQFDIDVSLALVEHLGIKYYVINIEDCFNGLISQIKRPQEKMRFRRRRLPICRRASEWRQPMLFRSHLTVAWQTPAIFRRTGSVMQQDTVTVQGTSARSAN